MPTAKIAKPAPPKPLSEAAAGKLCAEWQALDDERLELEKQARSNKRRNEHIERQLLPFVREAKGKLLVRELKKFRLEIEQRANWYGLKDALIDAIGEAEYDRRIEAAGTHDKLRITAKTAESGKPGAGKKGARG